MFILFIIFIQLAFSNINSKITIVKQFPPGLQEYWYNFPTQIHNSKNWSLENPVTLSIPIPEDVIESYITWNFSNTIYVYDPITTSTKDHIILHLSWWGKNFSLGIAFKQLFKN